MKKLLLILFVLINLQVQANEITFFNSNDDSQPENNIGVVDDPDQPAPIDDYAYVLGIGGIGLAVYCYRRKLILK